MERGLHTAWNPGKVVVLLRHEDIAVYMTTIKEFDSRPHITKSEWECLCLALDIKLKSIMENSK